MRIGKLSLVAAVALASSVYAFDPTEHNIKISGHVKLWYQTMDHQGVDDENGLFQFQDDTAGSRNEWGNVAAQIKMTGEANDHLSYGATINGVTSMGFNGHITGAETTRSDDAGILTAAETGKTQIPFWFHEIYANYKTGNTNFKLGRQELNTPLAYTEKWNATSNSFEALVITNTDLKDTTITGAWISKGNGADNSFESAPQVFGAENSFNNFMGYSFYTNVYGKDADGNDVLVRKVEESINPGGMLLIGAKNTSLGFPVQAWYYNTPDVMQALWLQADAKAAKLGVLENAAIQVIGAGIGTNGKIEKMIKAGDFSATNTKTDDTYGAAAKLSANISRFSAYAAFSQTSEGNLPLANTATNYKKTKLPTASVFSDGMVAAQPETTAFKVGAGVKIGEVSSLAVSYAGYEVGQNEGYFQPNKNVGGPASFGWIANNQGRDVRLSEVDVIFKTKYKDINLAAMYFYLDKTYVPGSDNSTYSYGTHENHIVRIVATLNF